jgi:hypothetical protein
MGVTLGLIFREGHRLRVFESWLLRKIFEPNRGQLTGEWEKLLNKEIRDMYSSPIIIIRVIKSR